MTTEYDGDSETDDVIDFQRRMRDAEDRFDAAVATGWRVRVDGVRVHTFAEFMTVCAPGADDFATRRIEWYTA